MRSTDDGHALDAPGGGLASRETANRAALCGAGFEYAVNGHLARLVRVVEEDT